jgi:hypothetical protein
MDTANEIATTILSWQQVYAPNLIVAAESCLRGANVEGWQFFEHPKMVFCWD